MQLTVHGMTCQHCVRTITAALQGRDPDARVDVDLDAGTVSVEGRLSRDEIEAAIDGAGYTVVAAAPAKQSCCGGCHA